MHDFYLNYERLKRLPIIKFSRIVYLLIILLIILIYIACHVDIERKIITYGIIENEILKIEINEKLSGKIKSSNKLILIIKK